MRKLEDWIAVAIVALIACIVLSSCEPVHAFDGYATYYTEASCKTEGTSGVYTASGAVYDESAMTCALRNRHFGRFWAVYGHDTEQTIYVRNTDYGPGNGPKMAGVVIDLTPAAFLEVCGDLAKGKCMVSVQEVQ